MVNGTDPLTVSFELPTTTPAPRSSESTMIATGVGLPILVCGGVICSAAVLRVLKEVSGKVRLIRD